MSILDSIDKQLKDGDIQSIKFELFDKIYTSVKRSVDNNLTNTAKKCINKEYPVFLNHLRILFLSYSTDAMRFMRCNTLTELITGWNVVTLEKAGVIAKREPHCYVHKLDRETYNNRIEFTPEVIKEFQEYVKTKFDEEYGQ